VALTAADSDPVTSRAGESNVERRCEVTYGEVMDKAARKNTSICRGGQDGQGLSRRVYVSQSNLLHIVFNTPDTAATQHQHNFIIHVEGESVKPKKTSSPLSFEFLDGTRTRGWQCDLVLTALATSTKLFCIEPNV